MRADSGRVKGAGGGTETLVLGSAFDDKVFSGCEGSCIESRREQLLPREDGLLVLSVVEAEAGTGGALSTVVVRESAGVVVASDASEANVTTVSEDPFELSVVGLCGKSIRFADWGLMRAGESVFRKSR